MSIHIITCPTCGFVGNEEDFDMSLCGECFCPKGCEWFELVGGDEDEEEGEGEDFDMLEAHK